MHTATLSQSSNRKRLKKILKVGFPNNGKSFSILLPTNLMEEPLEERELHAVLTGSVNFV